MNKVNQILKALTVAIFIFTSFSVSAQKGKASDRDVIEVKHKLNKMMSVFVENTRPFYKKGMTYTSFKLALTGNKRGIIPQEGEALLSKAFSYIENSSSSRRILNNNSGKEMAAALLFTLKYDKNRSIKNGDHILFGNSTGNTFPSSLMKTGSECKWYQLACWWNAIFGEYAGIIIDVLITLTKP